MSSPELHEKMQSARPRLMQLPNVVGVGLGEKIKNGRSTREMAILVLVRKKVPEIPASARVPERIDDVKTDVIEVGDPVPCANTGRLRPAPGGVSVGNVNMGTNPHNGGTLGVLVRSEADKRIYALSNNHTIALANLGNAGDAIIQPSFPDGGRAPRDVVGTLARFPLLATGLVADCAVAALDPPPFGIPDVSGILDAFSEPRQVSGWFGAENQGAGVALYDISGTTLPDLIVFHVDNAAGRNVGYYRIGWNVDLYGVVRGGWSPLFRVDVRLGAESPGGGIAVADLDNDGRPEIVIYYIDNPTGENHGYYSIGQKLDAFGRVTGGWTDPIAIPDWFGAESQGGDIAVADLNGDGRMELIVLHIDNPVGENHGYYRVGWDLAADGSVSEWQSPTLIPGWFGGDDQGAGVAVADVNGAGNFELVVTHVAHPPHGNVMYFRVATLDVTSNGGQWVANAPDWTARTLGGWVGNETQGCGVALGDLDGDGRPELVVLYIDNPGGGNRAYYRVSMSEWSGVRRWGSQPRGSAGPIIGERVWKSGRTTEITNATVAGLSVTQAIDFSYSINPSLGPLVTEDQILLLPGIGGQGDSGSAVVDSQGNVVGLLFASTLDAETGASIAGFANRIENVFQALQFSEPRQVPDWFGADNQGGGVAMYDVSNSGQPDMIVFHIDDPSGDNRGYYRIGWNVDANGIVRDGWTSPIPVQVPFRAATQGGGIAIADLDRDGRPELIVFYIDNPDGDNRGYYLVGRGLDANGSVTGGWTNPIPVPDFFGTETHDGDIAVANLNQEGIPNLIVFHIDHARGGNRGYYRIGRGIDINGIVNGGWTQPVPVPEWFGSQSHGGGITVANTKAAWAASIESASDLIVFHIDHASGGNRGYYRIGRNVDVYDGIARDGWSDPLPIPGWFGAHNQGGGLAAVDLNGNGRPELVVFHVDHPSGGNKGYYRVVYDLMPDGKPARWFIA